MTSVTFSAVKKIVVDYQETVGEDSPFVASFGQLLGKTLRSCSGISTPSMLPNIEDSPRQKSMMKKRTDQIGDRGICVIASVKTMKAKPVPSTPQVQTYNNSGLVLGLQQYKIKMKVYLFINQLFGTERQPVFVHDQSKCRSYKYRKCSNKIHKTKSVILFSSLSFHVAQQIWLHFSRQWYLE